ncbi:metal ABC transporter ATP-binding protein [Halorussus amylolyticus]|uniref:metal ABC transporter ATP-binding protein n=1 Tax=Halorussus amylolyticus TaxID=1126242 RepID=UPI00104C385F|nr:metal ABC transporter ATP-binding protein [Halorussus amylolyticus]
MNVVETRNLTFGYTATPVVEDVNLTVEAGEFLGIVGPNGSGKSTLLKLLLGLLEPDSGEARLFGEHATAFDDGERIGYVAQSVTTDTSEMPITVREAVLMGRYPHVGFGRITEDDRRKAREALETVGMSHLADRRVARLSGGQRQRTYIARALAAEAELLVLDEPTVGVDAESVAAFFELLADLHEFGLTVLLIEHDVGTVVERASTVLCMNREVLFHGSPDDFVESTALAEAYGATPKIMGVSE